MVLHVEHMEHHMNAGPRESCNGPGTESIRGVVLFFQVPWWVEWGTSATGL